MSFPKFHAFVCVGDTVTTDTDGYTLTATIYRDDCGDRPDQRSDGFWPSLDPKAAGYIGPKSQRTLQRRMATAQAVMTAWKNDEWFYCGVVVTVEREGVPLVGRYQHALWGIEANYPGSDNSYLSEVADELADEALQAAVEKVDALCCSRVEA